MKKVIFALIGAIVGLPASYYFQPSIVRMKVTLPEYITQFSEISQEEGMLQNVIISVIVCAIIGGVIGYFLDKRGSNSNV